MTKQDPAAIAWNKYQSAIRKAQRDLANATQKAYKTYMDKMDQLSKAADQKRKAKANVPRIRSKRDGSR